VGVIMDPFYTEKFTNPNFIDLACKDYVYLAGSIEGISWENATRWRNFSTEYLKEHGIFTLDPCRRRAVRDHEEEYGPNLANRIVKMDLRDIDHSQVVLANLTEEARGGGRSWGTVCEIAHSHTKNKIIIVVNDKDFQHPFIDFYATEQYFDLEEALHAVSRYYV
jgi:hypothetical protein